MAIGLIFHFEQDFQFDQSDRDFIGQYFPHERLFGAIAEEPHAILCSRLSKLIFDFRDSGQLEKAHKARSILMKLESPYSDSKLLFQSDPLLKFNENHSLPIYLSMKKNMELTFMLGKRSEDGIILPDKSTTSSVKISNKTVLLDSLSHFFDGIFDDVDQVNQGHAVCFYGGIFMNSDDPHHFRESLIEHYYNSIYNVAWTKGIEL